MFQIYGTAEIQSWNYPAKKLLDSEDSQMLPTPPTTKSEPTKIVEALVLPPETTIASTAVAFANRTDVTYADEDDSDNDIYKSLENVTFSVQIK